MATYQDLSTLGACEDGFGRNGEGEDGLVVLHAMHQLGGAARRRGRLRVAVRVHGGVMLRELCHQWVSLHACQNIRSQPSGVVVRNDIVVRRTLEPR